MFLHMKNSEIEEDHAVKEGGIVEYKKMAGEASLAEEVAEVLRTRIINGEYAIGEKLMESKVANELKVSRTPVREAFGELLKEELVEYIPNKGFFAMGFTMKDMADVYDVRASVEQLAIRRAVENAGDREIAGLGEHLELMRFYTENNIYEKLLKANEEFQNMIYLMTGSRFIVRILKTYQDYVHIARKNTLKKQEDLPGIFAEHAEIYEAVRSRDTEKAEEAVRRHLISSCHRAEEQWKVLQQRQMSGKDAYR